MYMPETNVLLTRFMREEGVGEVIDFMPVRESKESRANPSFMRLYELHGRCAARFVFASNVHQRSTMRVAP